MDRQRACQEEERRSEAELEPDRSFVQPAGALQQARHGLHLADLTSGQPHGGGSGQAGSAPTPRRPTDGAEPADEPRPALTLDPRLRALA